MLSFCGYQLLHQAVCKKGGGIIQKQQGTQLMFILDEVNIGLNVQISAVRHEFAFLLCYRGKL